MTAASFWSLLAPALEITERQYEHLAFLPVGIGFLAGAAFVFLADLSLPLLGIDDHYIVSVLNERTPTKKPNSGKEKDNTEVEDRRTSSGDSYNNNFEDDGISLRNRNRTSRNPDTEQTRREDAAKEAEYALSWRRVFLLIVAVTVHNIPEGLAVGVGFGAAGKSPSATFESARNLALGIGIQNFPEGLAVSVPLIGFGYSKMSSFWYGQLSGMVEPVAAVIGAVAVEYMEPLLPYALSFAAGAMIYVVVDDIIPEAQRAGNGKLASLGAVVGFLVMMSLDVGLG